MRHFSATLPVVALALGVAQPAAAEGNYLNFALRGGVAGAPSYPGSDDYRASPDLALSFGALRFGRVELGNGIGAIPDNGFAFRGALKVIGSRDQADHAALAGLGDIDTAVELGLGIVYRQTNWEVFGEVRQGFGGHEAVTGTLGANLVLRPDDRWTITAGPRINLGETDFARTYFGVTPAQAATSAFAPYDARGGVLGAGFQVQAAYKLDDNWALEGAVGYEKLLNDAANSPITALGSEDQWTVRIGLSRAFTLRF